MPSPTEQPAQSFDGDWSRSAANLCIHQVFESRAAATPDNVAVVFDDQRLSYRELNERANQLAHHLRRHGVGPDVLVGFCVERSIELVVGLLAILKAGGAYVPIDPQYPRERRKFMVEDSRAAVVLTQSSLAADLPVENAKVVLLDADWPEIAREPITNPGGETQQDHLAYVIYTSGSTGVPKGTLISHCNVVRLFQATSAWFDFDEHDVWTLFHSCAFDFSVWEMWGALFHGGKLVVVPFAVSRTPENFYRLLDRQRVTVLNQTPSAFRQLVRAEESNGAGANLALRFVIFGGEALDFHSLKPWFERHGDRQPKLINMYGITETTVHVTYRPIEAEDLGSSSMIGVPLPDLVIHLLDEHGQPVPVGVPGEIHVGGAGLARGYLHRPELTAQKFIPDPFAPERGKRLYRSGDLGQYLPNGDLMYLGRIDHQVKIRGFRIELGEISAALNSFPGVGESVATVEESSAGDKRLVAYLVRKPGADVNIDALRQSLRQRLPEYMMPAAVHFIDRIPLTVNGKLDVKALAAAQPPARPAPAAAANHSGTALERNIGAVWSDVLQRAGVGLDQNFFDVGGNSIHLAQVHERLQKLLQRQISITDLFAHSTIRALASHFASTDSKEGADQASRARALRQREALLAMRQANRLRK